jgi:hypothetical protein
MVPLASLLRPWLIASSSSDSESSTKLDYSSYLVILLISSSILSGPTFPIVVFSRNLGKRFSLRGFPSRVPLHIFPSIPSALVFHLRDFVTLVTFVSIANFFNTSLAVIFCEFNTMPELRSHKRGRSLDQRLFGNSEDRFITAGGEAEAEATTSDSEYDSDVIVVGKGRKCLRVSRTPPNHTPS